MIIGIGLGVGNLVMVSSVVVLVLKLCVLCLVFVDYLFVLCMLMKWIGVVMFLCCVVIFVNNVFFCV